MPLEFTHWSFNAMMRWIVLSSDVFGGLLWSMLVRHICNASNQFSVMMIKNYRLTYRLSGQAGCAHSPTSSPRLKNKAMKVTLCCIFSYISNIYTVTSPLMACIFLKINNLMIIFHGHYPPMRKRGGVLHPLRSHIKIDLALKWLVSLYCIELCTYNKPNIFITV